MKSSPTPGLIPLNDCVLVELKQSYKNVSISEGKYDTRTEGIVTAVPEVVFMNNMYYDEESQVKALGLTLKDLLGKRIHFEEFKEGARIKRESKIYSFIKIEDIRGYESVEAS
jgi:co-chaperonin GroES (HSP10)